MKHIVVLRNEEVTREDGFKIQTTGDLHLYSDGLLTTELYKCKSLEKGWVDNLKNISCIPPEPNKTAVYKWVVMDNSPLFSYPHILIKDVPKRTHIKIHVANRYDQLLGCIAVGLKFGYLPNDDVIDVVQSRQAMEGLMEALDGDREGTIEIISRVNPKHRKHGKDVADLVYTPPSLDDLDLDLTV